MTRKAKSILTAAMFGAGLCVNPAQAGEAGEQAGRESGKAAAPDKAAKKNEQRANDLVSCKRDAADLHGPERGSFMTKCLRRRD